MPRGLNPKYIQMARKAGAKNVFAYAWTLQKRRSGNPYKKVYKTRKRTSLSGKKMARRRRYYPRARRRRKAGLPSVASIASLMPHVLANLDYTHTLGYDISEPIIAGDYAKALKLFATNELMLFTGYDYIKQGFNFFPAIVNYASLLAPRIIRRIFGPKKVGPIRII